MAYGKDNSGKGKAGVPTGMGDKATPSGYKVSGNKNTGMQNPVKKS
jgi:hypothetical protein